MLMLIANGGDENGCLLVNCITELAPHDADVRAIAQDQSDWIESLLTTRFYIWNDHSDNATPTPRAVWMSELRIETERRNST